MRTGTDWNEDSYAGSPLEQLNQLQTDWLRFVIDWPMREEAGTRWQYNSGGVMALGRAIGLAAGMNTAEYARAYLLRQIGITRDKWIRGFPDLLPHTGGGLYMTSATSPASAISCSGEGSGTERRSCRRPGSRSPRDRS
jgi:CubicO group peptidase (beta-lactamase class C family)